LMGFAALHPSYEAVNLLYRASDRYVSLGRSICRRE
jgi:hypothetical protein